MSGAINELEVVAEPPDGQLPESVDDVILYAEYRRITEDQAALRRLAILVAQGAEPAEVLEAVVNEMRHCASADTAGLWRYESNDEMTKLAAAEHPGLHLAKWPVGTRSPIDGATLAGIVQRTGRPARMDSYGNTPGHSRRGYETRVCTRRSVCPSSSMDGCGAWRPWVRLNPSPCRPTPKGASAPSPS